MDIFIIKDGDFTVNYNRGQNEPPILFNTPIKIKLSVCCYLLKTENENILIDSGIGDNYFYNKDKYSVVKPRKLISSLLKNDVDPENITNVIFTHLHFDHCNGILDHNGECIFKNARFKIQQPEWDRYLETERTEAKNSFIKLNDQKRIELLNSNTKISEKIMLISGSGHTKGFQYVIVKDGNDSEHIFAGDIIPTVWHMNNENKEDIDYDINELEKSKTEILERCIKNNSILYFQHSSSILAGKITKDKNKYRIKKI